MPSRARLCLVSLAALLTASSISCAQNPPAQPPPLPPGVVREAGVVYGKAGVRELHLNIERPDPLPAGPTPVIVYIHGGGWRGGTHSNGSNVQLARLGFFCVNVEYRLSGEALWPAQIHDCKAAVRWLRANADKYHLDGDHIGVWGHSAGGHLAALMGTSGDVKELEGECGNPGYSTKVHAVVDGFGPTDFVGEVDADSSIDRRSPNAPESLLFGKPIPEVPELVRQANPLTYIDKDDPPFLVQHGIADRVVPVNQSDVLVAALKQAGVPVEYHRIEGAGHSFVGLSKEKAGEEYAAALKFFIDRLSGGQPPRAPAGGR